MHKQRLRRSHAATRGILQFDLMGNLRPHALACQSELVHSSGSVLQSPRAAPAGVVKNAAVQCKSLIDGDDSMTRNRLCTELSTGIVHGGDAT